MTSEHGSNGQMTAISPYTRSSFAARFGFSDIRLRIKSQLLQHSEVSQRTGPAVSSVDRPGNLRLGVYVQEHAALNGVFAVRRIA